MEGDSHEPDVKRAKLLLQLKNGHDCIFTKNLPEHLQVECSVCLCVLHDPHMIDCECGASFCQPCIQPTLKEKKSCPLCNSPFTALFPARQLQRTLNSLQVYCSFKEAGCEWVGELGAIAEHLHDDIKLDGYKSSGCPFMQLKCTHCKQEFQRRYVLEHETNKCLKRPFKCDCCNEYESTFEDVTTKHINVCPCELVPCPNNCGESLQRKSIDDHVTSQCPLEIVSCSFSYTGCEEKLPRKDMPAHISESVAVHMSLQAVSHQKELEELKIQIRELQAHLRIMPITILLDEFASKKAEGKNWSSHPFYTHLQGYKLCLSVYCNGIKSGEGTHISMYIYVMSGKHDDELEWPFKRSITIQLLDQKEGKDHHDHVMNFNDASDECTKKVEKFVRRSGWGTTQLITHSELSPKYLVNDSLYFKIS